MYPGLFPRPPEPMPKSVRHISRQPMAQLASEHDQVPSMVRLVSHELAEKMLQVRRDRAGGNVNNDLAHDTSQFAAQMSVLLNRARALNFLRTAIESTTGYFRRGP